MAQRMLPMKLSTFLEIDLVTICRCFFLSYFKDVEYGRNKLHQGHYNLQWVISQV